MNSRTPAICIPFVYPNIDNQTVIKTITELGLGNNISIESKNTTNKRGETGRIVRIDIDWFKNENATKVRRQLAQGKSININYSPKSFWKLFAYKTQISNPVSTAAKHEQLYGPKLGLNCREKEHKAQIRIDPNYVPKQQLFRPKTPDMPPPNYKEPEKDTIICISEDVINWGPLNSDGRPDFPDEFEADKFVIDYGTSMPMIPKKVVPMYKKVIPPTISDLLYGDL